MKIIIGQSVFVYLTLSLSLYLTLYLCFCLFAFAVCSLSTLGPWAGGCQQFSLELINRDDDDEEFFFKWPFGCCHRIRRIWAYTRNYTAQIRKYRNTKTIDRTRRRPPTMYWSVYPLQRWGRKCTNIKSNGNWCWTSPTWCKFDL